MFELTNRTLKIEEHKATTLKRFCKLDKTRLTSFWHITALHATVVPPFYSSVVGSC